MSDGVSDAAAAESAVDSPTVISDPEVLQLLHHGRTAGWRWCTLRSVATTPLAVVVIMHRFPLLDHLAIASSCSAVKLRADGSLPCADESPSLSKDPARTLLRGQRLYLSAVPKNERGDELPSAYGRLALGVLVRLLSSSSSFELATLRGFDKLLIKIIDGEPPPTTLGQLQRALKLSIVTLTLDKANCPAAL